MRKISLIVFASLLVFAISQSWAGDESAKLKQKIEQINDGFAKAIVAGDIEKMYSYYVDDAVSMPNYGPLIKGKANMIQQEKEMREAGFKVHSINFSTADVWGCGEMVYETGTYGISLTLPGVDVPVADTGKYLTVWQKDSAGSLKMKYEIWNTDMNPWKMGEHMGEHQQEPEMK